MRFQYWRAPSGDWHWHLRAANGEIIAQGEGYAAKADVLHVIGLLKDCTTARVTRRVCRKKR